MTLKLRGLLFLAITLFLAYRFGIRYGLGEAREEANDFPSYYYAAYVAFDLDTEPYSRPGWNVAKSYYKTEGADLYPFLYPPPSLLFFRVFTLMEYETAKLVMLGLNHILILIFWILFFFKILEYKTSDLFPLAGSIYLYAFFPMLLNIYYGQINIIILVLTCLSWLAIKEKRHPAWSGFLIAVSVILKLYPILFLIVLFFRKEYKTIIYSIVIILLISAIATVVLPHGTWETWYENVASRGYMKSISGIEPGRPANQSVNAFLVRLFMGQNVRFGPIITPPNWAIRISPYLVCGFFGLISLMSAWLFAKNHGNDLNLQVSIWILVIFMVAPISYDYILVWILPSIYIAFLETYKRGWFLALPILAGLSYFLAINFDFNNPDFRQGWKTLLISAKLYAVALLWLFFVILSMIKKTSLLSTHTNNKVEIQGVDG